MAFYETPKSFSFSQQFATAPYLETVEYNPHNSNVLSRTHFDITVRSVPMNFRSNISKNLLLNLLLFLMLRAPVHHDRNQLLHYQFTEQNKNKFTILNSCASPIGHTMSDMNY
jgi:hypothetical protein